MRKVKGRVQNLRNPEKNRKTCKLTLNEKLEMLYYITKFGKTDIKQNVVGGQYHYPKGIFFGGNKLSQSHTLLSKYLKKDHNICFIDNMFNMTRKISNVSKKKIFYNQITLKIRPYYNPELDINLNLMVNLKLFRNGKLQLCGLKNENDGLLAIKILVKELN